MFHFYYWVFSIKKQYSKKAQEIQYLYQFILQSLKITKIIICFYFITIRRYMYLKFSTIFNHFLLWIEGSQFSGWNQTSVEIIYKFKNKVTLTLCWRMYADDSNSLYSLITISGKKKKKMFKTFDTHIANMSFNEKSLLHLFCIYSLNKDFITHSECFQIFNFKNNKIKKKNPTINKQTKPNKQTNPPFNKERSFF